MNIQINDLVIHIATVNGSGSQSSNSLLTRGLFKMGIPVGAKNLFPSNIAGLPTWFQIRANANGYTGRKDHCDIMVAMNATTLAEDMKAPTPGGYFIYNSDLKVIPGTLREDVTNIGIPFKKLVKEVTDSVKLKKLLTNMIYVGVLAEILGITHESLDEALKTQFLGKEKLIPINQKALEVGKIHAQQELPDTPFHHKVEAIPGGSQGKILLDGNTASGMGLLFGGCSFVAWYPITPSSSVVETFMSLAKKHRKQDYAVVQGEDELSSIGMVVGAGWAGARAITATSGPGISLMAETAGLSYYAEIPAVIWNVQRGGPSTGLPTRTAQGDVTSCAKLSHGDTDQILLFPATPKECFEMGQTCFDLAEELQTLVIVMSDLDLGMNITLSDEFEYPTEKFKRGKVLNAEDLEKVEEFARYRDVDGDGIPYRTLPGTHHEKAAFFTRGTGHDDRAGYSENPKIYKDNLDRLVKKFKTAERIVPAPVVDKTKGARVGIIAYGTTDVPMTESRDLLSSKNVASSYLRLKAYPLTQDVENFIDSHEKIYVVEQNRDAQMLELIRNKYPQSSGKLDSVINYNGMPIEAEFICDQILNKENQV